MSHDAMSLGKLKIILAALQCNCSIEQHKSELLHASHNIRAYCTDVRITLIA